MDCLIFSLLGVFVVAACLAAYNAYNSTYNDEEYEVTWNGGFWAKGKISNKVYYVGPASSYRWIEHPSGKEVGCSKSQALDRAYHAERAKNLKSPF